VRGADEGLKGLRDKVASLEKQLQAQSKAAATAQQEAGRLRADLERCAPLSISACVRVLGCAVWER
jgi:hypothetical protein